MKIIVINSPKYGRYEVLVDDEDYDFLMQWKWQVQKTRVKNKFYIINAKKIKNKTTNIKLHRIILGETDPNIHIDHINGNRLDNQKKNLRRCKSCENAKNISSHANSSSKFLGVHLSITNRGDKRYMYWRSMIHVGNKWHSLGYYPYTPEGEVEAAKSYDEAAKIHHKEFANLNFK